MCAKKREANPCPYCWLVYYSKGALTKHLNEVHWDEIEEEDNEQTV